MDQPFSLEVESLASGLSETELVIPYRFELGGFLGVTGADAAVVQEAFPRLVAAITAGEAEMTAETAAIGADHARAFDLLSTDLSMVLSHVDPALVVFDDTVPYDEAIWLHEAVAEDLGLGLGDVLVAGFVDSKVEELRVAAIYSDSFFFGDHVIDNMLHERHWPQDTSDFLSLSPAGATTRAEMKSAVEAALANGYPELVVEPSPELPAGLIPGCS